jgi:phosphomannomutase
VTGTAAALDLPSLIADARAWRDQDPDEETRAELDALLAVVDRNPPTDAAAGAEGRAGFNDAIADLGDRFASRLQFGTAGLRGELGAGPNRMNRVLVAQAAAGLAAFLVARASDASIVIGYDGRKNSSIFATDTAEIMAGAGVRAILLPRALPTPVLAFAVRHLGVSAGVMVTASHNPAADNGYKVYLGGADGGSQIVPPSDGEIAAQIERIARGDIRSLPRLINYDVAGEDVLNAYVARAARLSSSRGPSSAVPSSSAGPSYPGVRLAFVYTALHGVGWETTKRVFADAGFEEPTVVAEQIEPDATFPTVAFPNPEEPGALDLAFTRAAEVAADLVIANDPDADRLAVGVPTEDGWRRLSGNEVGLLLGWRAAERATSGTLACSIVSSPGLAAIASAYGLDFVETLTGFKWISRVPGMAFGFEEALGYLVDPGAVRDKDGISAAVELLALASELKRQGKTLADHADDFAARFGAYASSQISLRFTDLPAIPQIMNRLRANPPRTIDGVAVSVIEDFRDGIAPFAPEDIVRIRMSDGSRIVVRPSGTEPKLKAYIDAWSTVGTPRERMAAAAAAIATLDAGMRGILSSA